MYRIDRTVPNLFQDCKLPWIVWNTLSTDQKLHSDIKRSKRLQTPRKHVDTRRSLNFHFRLKVLMNLVSSFFHYGHELRMRYARQSSSESFSQSVVSQVFAIFEGELCPNTKEAAADTSLWSLDPIRMLYGVDEEDNDIWSILLSRQSPI